MHAWLQRGSVGFLALATFIAGPAIARERRSDLVPPGWSVRHVRIENSPRHRQMRMARGEPTFSERGLTIRRRFEQAPDADDDPLFDGATHYDNIRLFDPAPTIDSGTQFPYGLDGIGGYGSDLGFGAAGNESVYDRGQ